MLCLCYTCVVLLLETLGVSISVWDKTHSLLGVNAQWHLGCIFNRLFLKKDGEAEGRRTEATWGKGVVLVGSKGELTRSDDSSGTALSLLKDFL